MHNICEYSSNDEDDVVSSSNSVNRFTWLNPSVSYQHSRVGDYTLHLCAAWSDNYLASALSSYRILVSDSTTLKLLHEYVDKHSGRISSVRIDPSNPLCFISSSHDGTLKYIDTRSNLVAHNFTAGDICSHVPAFTCVDVHCDGRFVCAGTEMPSCVTDGDNSLLVFWDMRARASVGAYWNSHNDDITDVRFCGHDRCMLAVSSQDSLVNVYDVTQDSEEKALRTTFNTTSSAQSLHWLSNTKLAMQMDIESLIFADTNSAQMCTFSRESIADVMLCSYDDVYIGCICPISENILAITGNVERPSEAHVLQVDMPATLKTEGAVNASHLFCGRLPDNGQIIRCGAYSVQDKVLALAGESQSLHVWDHGIL